MIMNSSTFSTIALTSAALCMWCASAHAQERPTPPADKPGAQVSPKPATAPTDEETPEEKETTQEELGELKVSPAYNKLQARADEEKARRTTMLEAVRVGRWVASRGRYTGAVLEQDQVASVQALLKGMMLTPTEASPRLDDTKPIYCFTVQTDDRKMRGLRIQFDNESASYLIAEDTLYKESLQDGKLVSTRRRTQQLGRSCAPDSASTLQYVAEAMGEGYTMIPAKLDTAYGYARDELNRTFQTHFDLRSRFGVGVYYVGNLNPGAYSNTMGLEVFGTYEDWDPYARTRRRTRFLEGRLSLAPFFARATVFETEESEQSEDPLLFIATMVGTPRRFDINLDIHFAGTLGRLDYRTLNGKQYSQLDIAEGRLQWELLRSMDMEDFVLIHAGAGVGTRRWTDGDSEPLYVYPQVGARGAWTLSPRGLLELQAEANLRWGAEFEGDEAKWTSASSSVGIEWLVLSLSNQPLTLFARHEWEYLDLRGTKRDTTTHSMRWSVGGRVSLFVPPPKRAKPSEEQP